MFPVNLFLLFLAAATPEAQLRTALEAKTGVATLPAGVIEISREIVLPPDAHDLEIRGAGLTLKASAAFRGRALIVIPAGKNIRIHGLTLDGNRDAIGRPIGLPPVDAMYSRFMPNNGILAENVTDLETAQVKASKIAGFTALVNGGRGVRIHGVEISESGGLNPRSHNNATGGILLEEGVADFEVTDCRIAGVRGNGVTVQSRADSPRAAHGRIASNEFAQIGRDAIRVGEATDVRVENNRGREIGYPSEEVDAVPSAIETAGHVDHAIYRNNQFEEINGRCIGLDGLHDGEVASNTCINADELRSYPYGNIAIMMNDSANIRITGNTVEGNIFGAMLLAGSGHTITGNHLLRLNFAHCNDPGPVNCTRDASQPDLHRSGIYLGAGAKGNTITGNEIGGYGMSRHCIAAGPGASLAANTVARNDCADEATIARLASSFGLPAKLH